MEGHRQPAYDQATSQAMVRNPRRGNRAQP